MKSEIKCTFEMYTILHVSLVSTCLCLSVCSSAVCMTDRAPLSRLVLCGGEKTHISRYYMIVKTRPVSSPLFFPH